MTVFAEMTVEEILQLVLDNVSIVKSNSELEDLQVCKKITDKEAEMCGETICKYFELTVVTRT
jgi:hypothetical protein